MAQTKLGADKIAAQKCGLTLDDYLERLAQGFKRCVQCKEWKVRDEFAADRSRYDGKAARCLQCGRVERRKILNHGGPPDRVSAQAAVDAVRYAIKKGRLASPGTLPCFDCGAPAVHYHHHIGYAPVHRLDVVALCRSCHRKRHIR